MSRSLASRSIEKMDLCIEGSRSVCGALTIRRHGSAAIELRQQDRRINPRQGHEQRPGLTHVKRPHRDRDHTGHVMTARTGAANPATHENRCGAAAAPFTGEHADHEGKHQEKP